jgi:hypothetical protein
MNSMFPELDEREREEYTANIGIPSALVGVVSAIVAGAMLLDDNALNSLHSARVAAIAGGVIAGLMGANLVADAHD